ncbi:MAG TPA: GMC family oxidoreductase N-terminal domain-containing protein, partial [Burkholderiales bacterium]|nr:GMC family oxidoreductase N-terminal domain-containing protein [Burkholderiales bacterium]
MEKPEWLSEGAEALVEQCARGTPFYDVLIVGSGYGGSVAAARLAGAADESTGEPLKVCVLERGREHVPGTFPNSFSELPGEMRFSRFDEPGAKGASDGLFDLRIGKEVSVLVANGLGGGSLVNAGVAAIPEPDVFETGWPREIREEFADAEAMRAAYRQASGKLGARLAQVGARGTYPEIAKHAAFVRFAGEARAERAAVTYDDETCRRCGDCATGCNVGAKTTLSHTYLGAARARGAKLYTGATVSHLERDGGAWTVHFSLTAQPRPLEARPLRALRAATVILAAGAFGSTEILLRSKQSGGLAFSPRLGERFSTNGDMISALYGGHEQVNAAARESQPLEQRHVGPTITGIAVCGESRAERIVLEELAIPGALRKVFGEVVTTAAMLAALAKRDDEEHPAFSPYDPQAARAGAAPADAREPLAVDEQALERCQVFAAMGDDGAGGRLELVPGWQDLPEPARARDGAIRVDWPDAGQQPIYAKQDALLAGLAKGRGTYLRNPLWQPIPPDVSRFFSGAKPAGLLFSVHPLGGCPMGDDATRGVVDQMGRVFDPQKQADGKGVHEGLLVLDGSIVPVALGINPLLTITVLAERALELYCRGRWTRPTAPPQPLPEAPRIERPPPPAALTGVRFSERAGGALRLAPGGPQVEARLDFDFDEVRELGAFLEDPRHPMQGRGTLALREAADEDFAAPCALSGDVQFLVRGASTSSGRIWPALWTYARTRLVADVRSWWRNGRKPLGAPDPAPASDAARASFAERARRDGFWLALADGLLRPLLDRFSVGRGYVTLASRIGELRHVFYELRLDSALEGRGARLPAGTRISGRKFFRYAAPQSLRHPFGGNPWRQLADLELTAHPPGGAPFRMGLLSVDVGHFFHGFESRLRISRQRDLPSAWLDLAALGLFFARVLLKAHFSSFRLPDYAKYDPRRDAARLPGELPGLRMGRYIVGYPPGEAERVVLPLTRY